MKLAHQILSWVADLWQNMTPARWTTLISYGLAVVGFGVWLSERKWEDAHRKEAHKRWMCLGRTLWAIGLIALGVAVLCNIKQRERAPAFLPLVNGVPALANALVTIPVTNDFQSMEFRIVNTGDRAADGLLLSVFSPQGLNVTASGK